MVSWRERNAWIADLLERRTGADVATWNARIRDFDPFAWMPNRPWAGDWLWGMGTEPGQRVLNGGQRNRYGEPIHPPAGVRSTRATRRALAERIVRSYQEVYAQLRERHGIADGDVP